MDASKISTKLLAAINEPMPMEDQILSPSASMGISFYPQHGDSSESLLKNADIAMYESKHQGKNTYSIFTTNEKILTEV